MRYSGCSFEKMLTHSVYQKKITKLSSGADHPVHTASRVCSLHKLACVCVHSKPWLAARVSPRLACMPRPARARCSRRQLECATIAAAPVLSAHASGPFHVGNTYDIDDTPSYLGYPCLIDCVRQRLKIYISRLRTMPQTNIMPS